MTNTETTITLSRGAHSVSFAVMPRRISDFRLWRYFCEACKTLDRKAAEKATAKPLAKAKP